MAQQMNPAGISAVQFLFGYDRHGRKKPRHDWPYALPSPVVNADSRTTVFHTLALRRPKPLYALDIVKEMTSYIVDTYGHDLTVVNARSEADPRPTPLHVAAFCTNIEVVDALLRVGADREAVDDEGFTPVERAAAVMTEEIEVDEGRGLTEGVCRREIERRKAVYEMLGGDMGVFEEEEVEELETLLQYEMSFDAD